MQDRVSGPDGARSWGVAFAAFVINVLLSGLSRSTGLFYVSLINVYGTSRGEANLPFTLRNIVRNLLGPLVGVLGQRYGAREVTMLGGFFAAAGISLCFFAPNVTWICLLWGGLHGIGVALGNTLFQVIVTQYFVKHRATASGFAFSGGCVGSFTFPIILEYMLDHLGLQGAFLLTGAFVLHVIPAGIMMIVPPWVEKTRKDSQEGYDVDVKAKNIVRENKFLECERGGIYVIKLKKVSSFSKLKDENCEAKREAMNGVDNGVFHSKENCDHRENGAFTFTEKKKDHSHSKDHVATQMEDGAQASVCKSFRIMCCDPMFYMISLSLAAFVTVFDLFLIVIVDYMKDKAIPEDSGKYFISIMSLGDLFGRLCLGYVTDRNYMTVSNFMMVLHVVQGLTFALVPVFYSPEVLFGVVFLCGLAGGGNVIMYPILVAKYLPSIQSLSIGCITFVGGIVSFGIPPLIGYFRDTAGSYDYLYYMIGGLSVVCGLLWLMEPLLLKMKAEAK